MKRALAEAGGEPPAGCVDAETLAAWTAGTLRPAQASSVELHLSSCADCQSLLAAFARATPDAPAPVSLWQRWHLQWFVPLATAAATVAIWFAIPGRTIEPSRERQGESSIARLPPPATATPQMTSPAVGALIGAPETRPSRADAPSQAAPESPAQRAAVKARAEQLLQKKAKEENADRLTAVADASRPATDNRTRASQGAERPPAPLQESVVVATSPAAAAPAAAAVPPPTVAPAAAAAASPEPAAPKRQEQATGGLQSRVFLRQAFTETASPSSATRWRVNAGGGVTVFTSTVPAGRPSDIPATAQLLAGSSPADQVCWIVGRAGAIYLTTDGTHFTLVPFPYNVDLVSVRATDATNATVTSATGRSYGTTDGGRTWNP